LSGKDVTRQGQDGFCENRSAVAGFRVDLLTGQQVTCQNRKCFYLNKIRNINTLFEKLERTMRVRFALTWCANRRIHTPEIEHDDGLPPKNTLASAWALLLAAARKGMITRPPSVVWLFGSALSGPNCIARRMKTDQQTQPYYGSFGQSLHSLCRFLHSRHNPWFRVCRICCPTQTLCVQPGRNHFVSSTAYRVPGIACWALRTETVAHTPGSLYYPTHADHW